MVVKVYVGIGQMDLLNEIGMMRSRSGLLYN